MTPRALPEGTEFIEELRLPDGRRFGDVMAPFQCETFQHYFDPLSPPNLWVSRPRGGSKTTDVAALAVHELVFAPTGSLMVAVAADQNQARLLLDAMRRWRDANPHLKGFQMGRNEVRNPATGSVLRTLASDTRGNLGLTPWRVFADELAAWGSREHWDVMQTALPKVPGSRAIVTSTAGSPSHWSFGVWQHAHDSDKWSVQHTHDLAPWLDPEQLADLMGASANHLSASARKRWLDNIWSTADDAIFIPGEIQRVTDDTLSGMAERGVKGTRYVVGVDLGITHDRTAIATIEWNRGEQPNRLVRLWVHVPSREHPTSIAAVEAELRRTHEMFGPVAMLADPYEARGSIERLPFLRQAKQTGESVAAQSRALLAAIRDGGILLPPNELLRAELLGLIEKESGQHIRFDHPPGGHNDATTALAIALRYIEQHERPRRGMRVYSSATDTGAVELGRNVPRASSRRARVWTAGSGGSRRARAARRRRNEPIAPLRFDV
jgi:hypothetical protein